MSQHSKIFHEASLIFVAKNKDLKLEQTKPHIHKAL